MGNPCFYYYPVAGGTLQKIDLGTLRLSDLLITPIRVVADSISRAGVMYRDIGGMRLQVKVLIENFSDESLVRKFRNMGNHLERGGAVGFALDTDKVWAGFVDPGPLSQGATTLPTPGGNAWSSWSTGSLADDDPIVLQSAPPESILEHHTMNGSALSTATTILTDTGIEADHTQGPHLVRYRDFWPSLKMPEDQVRRLAGRGICHSHRRLNYTFDLTLVEDWGPIRASSSVFSPSLPGETTGSSVRFQHMEDPGPRAIEPTYPTVHPYGL